jgi:hypothetical protein
MQNESVILKNEEGVILSCEDSEGSQWAGSLFEILR